MLRIHRSKITISTVGSTKSQKALGFMSAKLNDVLDINLHVIPKITNAIPSQEIDVSQLRHSQSAIGRSTIQCSWKN